jgi:site-specific recombinase XerD
MASENKQRVLSKIYEYLEMKEKRGLTKGTIYNYLLLLNKLVKFESIDTITIEGLNNLIYGSGFVEKRGKRDGLARRFYFMIVCKNFFQFVGRNDLVEWLNAVGLPKYKQESPKPVAKEIIETVLNFETIPKEELSDEDKKNL